MGWQNYDVVNIRVQQLKHVYQLLAFLQNYIQHHSILKYICLTKKIIKDTQVGDNL